eukprot:11170353-Lingulodinium_polyedra.AAC.2
MTEARRLREQATAVVGVGRDIERGVRFLTRADRGHRLPPARRDSRPLAAGLNLHYAAMR